MRLRFLRPSGLLGLLAPRCGGAHDLPPSSWAADLKGGRLRVALLADMTNFDPQQFSTVNFPLIKNLYDSLIEYTPDGKAVPSLATAWEIAPDNTSVTLTLRKDVKFHSGAPFNAEAVAATLKKAADPQKGKNVYATMSFVKDWTVVDPHTIRLNFKGPAPERQITDLLQFLCRHRSRRHRHGRDRSPPAPAPTCSASAWSGSASASRPTRTTGARRSRSPRRSCSRSSATMPPRRAALESGAVDIIYGGTPRSAVRLKRRRLPAHPGPGPAGAGLPHQLDPRAVQERRSSARPSTT